MPSQSPIHGANPLGSLERLAILKTTISWPSLPDTCLGDKFYWIDQLSINQDSKEEVASALAMIPEIYRRFEVIVLLPGAMCECIVERYSMITDQADNVNTTLTNLSGVPELTGCWNNISFANWFVRIWPRQELLYARSIQARWVSPGALECPLNMQAFRVLTSRNLSRDKCWDLLLEVSGKLNIVPRLRFNSPVESNLGFHYSQVVMEASYAVCEAVISLRMWASFHQPWDQRTRSTNLIRFLRGEKLIGTTEYSNRTERERLRWFMYLLEAIASSDRATNDNRDLVLAVWVDCPGYKVPLNCKRMSFPELLEDAICQLERNWNISLVTSMPAGLFDNTKQSDGLLWRPSVYQNTVHGSKQAYGAVATSTIPFVVHSSGKVPLVIKPRINNTLRSTVMDFEDNFCDAEIGDIVNIVGSVCKSWSPSLLTSLESQFMWKTRTLETYTSDFLKFLSAVRKTINADKAEFTGDELRLIEARTDNEHELRRGYHDFVYLTVCEALGLDREFCRKHGLRVIVDFGSEILPRRLGLSRLNYSTGNDLSTYTVCPRHLTSIQLGTFAAESQPSEEPSDVMYEVTFESGDKPEAYECDDYEVVGVWIRPLFFHESGVHGYAPVWDLGKGLDW